MTFTLCGILGLNELFGKPFCSKLSNKKDPLFANMKILNIQAIISRCTLTSTLSHLLLVPLHQVVILFPYKQATPEHH